MTDLKSQTEPNNGRPFFAGLPGLIRNLYLEEGRAWRKHYREYFKHAARALGLGFVAGLAYFMLRPGQEQKALDFVIRALKDIPLEASPLLLALTIFYHNARASAVAVVAGWIPFLFLPILDPLVNGGVLGLLVSVSKHQGLDVPRLILTKILPHGIFELTAVLYATSLGLYLSAATGKKAAAAWRRSRGGRWGEPAPVLEVKDFLETYPERSAARDESPAMNVLRSFVLVVLPLLLIAAFVESFVTKAL